LRAKVVDANASLAHTKLPLVMMVVHRRWCATMRSVEAAVPHAGLGPPKIDVSLAFMEPFCRFLKNIEAFKKPNAMGRDDQVGGSAIANQ
jgi:hypothetical protein